MHPFLSAFKFGLRYAFGIISAWEALGWRAVVNPLVSSRDAMEAKFVAARKVRTGHAVDAAGLSRGIPAGRPCSTC
jgi:hypothetical protein